MTTWVSLVVKKRHQAIGIHTKVIDEVKACFFQNVLSLFLYWKKTQIFFSPYNVFFFPSFYRKQIILGLLSEISDVENKLLSVHCVMQIYPPLPRKEKKAYLQANVRLLSKYVLGFFAKIEATFLSKKRESKTSQHFTHSEKSLNVP